jgi:hypothetical protein
VRGFEGSAQAGGERAFACAVDTLDNDEHAASLSGRERSLPLDFSAIISSGTERSSDVAQRRLAVATSRICCGTACDDRI